MDPIRMTSANNTTNTGAPIKTLAGLHKKTLAGAPLRKINPRYLKLLYAKDVKYHLPRLCDVKDHEGDV
jgi:hypothetical protein